MPSVVSGSEEVVFSAYSTSPAAVGITIPSGTTAVYIFGSFIGGSDGDDFDESSFSLSTDGAYDEFNELATTSGSIAVCVAAWYNPTTGAQDLTVAMNGAVDEGAAFHAVYVQDGDTSAWRDVDTDADNTSTDASVTLTTVSGDLVILHAVQIDYSSTPPVLPSGFTNILTGGQEGPEARSSYIEATGSTQVCPSDAANDIDAVIAISIPATAGGGVTIEVPTGPLW